MTLSIAILIYLIWVNLMAYRAFADDKRRAIAKDQRTPEATLLNWARFGGWVGAKYAQQKLRHKSYKEPFGSRLNIIGTVHAITLVAVFAIFVLKAATPDSTSLNAAVAMAWDAWQVGSPDDEGLQVSLRPPVGRLSGL